MLLPEEYSRKRIYFMDEVRGFCILCMVIYHAGYDLLYLFGQHWISPFMTITTYLQPFFAAAFIFISGISSRLSRSNVMRGAKLFFIAAIISYFTLIFMPDNAIRFGILNMLSICMLLYGVCEKIFLKINKYIGIIICAVLFILTYNIQMGYIGIRGLFEIPLPETILSTYDLYPLGITTSGFTSSDYFPLLPWLFIFLAGTFVGSWAKENKFPKFMYTQRLKPLSFIGKHTLLIYVLHQPVIYGLLYVIFAIISALTP